MAGWHHRLNEDEFEQALGDGKGQGSLACCSPRCCKEPDLTKPLDNNSNALRVVLDDVHGENLNYFYGLLSGNIRHLTCGEILLRTLFNRKLLASPDAQRKAC